LKNDRLERLQDIEEKKARIIKSESVDVDKIMAGSRHAAGGDNDKKRSHLDDHYGSSSRGSSPAPSLAGCVLKKARTSDSDDITSLPQMNSVIHTPRSNSDTEMVDAVKTRHSAGAGGYQKANGHEDFEAQNKVTQKAQKLQDKKSNYDQAKEKAVREERVRVKRETKGRPLTAEEERDAIKICMEFNRGDDCPRLSIGCPYYHNTKAHETALWSMNRMQLAREKINPDSLSIDESDTDDLHDRHEISEEVHGDQELEKINPDEMDIDGSVIGESITDTSEEMDIEIPRPPKQYSEFVQRLMLKLLEMSEIVNVVKRRPTAVDMWKLDDERRREEMNS